MNYSAVNFLIALVTVAVMLPGTFLLNAKVIAPGDTWHLGIYLGVSVLCFVISNLCRSVIWSMLLQEIGRMGILCTLFLFASYCADEGDAFLSVDGFWEGVGVWLVTVVVLSACFAAISGAFYSLFSAGTWAWPANIINNLAYAAGAFFIGLLTFCFVIDICPAAAICSLISFAGLGGGKDFSELNEAEVFTDECGREVRGRRYGDRFIEEGSGNAYRQRPDNGKWECM